MFNLNLSQSVGFRLFIISVLVVLLLIPTIFIMVMIEDRQETSKSAGNEISEKWGKQQTVTGPILKIPYRLPVRDSTGKMISRTEREMIILPESLNVFGKINPEKRSRGIFEVVVYSTNLKLNGEFNLTEALKAIDTDYEILWKEASVNIGISDLSGLANLVKIDWNKTQIEAGSGTKITELIPKGLSASVSLTEKEMKYSFSTEININGSSKLEFSPVGKTTTVELQSDWADPKFSGAFLPQDRKVLETGFSAKWNVLFLNRNYPQFWTESIYKFEGSDFGVDLIIPVDHYQKTLRTVKYAIMFIGFTFMAFFMIEIFDKKRLHPIQYLLIGIALVIFYTLLLSITEHISFNWSYLISGMATIGMITLYTKSVLQNLKATLLIFGILIILYGFMFVVLQLEDYALMIGSFGLFATLAIVMYVTRKVDWYQLELKSEKE